MHTLLKTLCDDGVAAPIGAGDIEPFIADRPGRLRVVFLAGNPDKKLETADVAIVLRELVKAYPGAMDVGLVTPDAESEVMDFTGVFAVPSLIVYGGGRKLETLPKIQDWSVYAEAFPRLIEAAKGETV